MKRWSPIIVSVCIFLADISQAQEAAKPDPVAETVTFVAQMGAQITQARRALETAVDQAAKAGTLTEPALMVWRSLLGKFKESQSVVISPKSIEGAPSTDSKGLEALRSAWNDFRMTINQVNQNVQSRRELLRLEVNEALETAAKTATKPEDLATARTRFAAFQLLPPDSRVGGRERVFAGHLTQFEDAVPKILSMAEGALKANVKGDFTALKTALGQLPNLFFVDHMETEAKAGWEEFQVRLSAGLRTGAVKAQRAVESALMNRKPAAERDGLIDELATRLSDLVSTFNGFYHAHRNVVAGRDHDDLIRHYRSVSSYLIWEAAPVGDDRETPSQLLTDEFPASAEYRAFFLCLLARHESLIEASMQREERAKMEAEQKEATRVAESKKQRDAQVQTEIGKQRQKVKSQIKTAKNADELVAIIDSLPADKESDMDRLRGRQTDWAALAAALQQVAVWWVDPKDALDPFANARTPMPAAFAAELRDLRERVLKELLANRFSAPELTAPAFSELPARVALLRVAEAAGKKGEWDRAHLLLQVFAKPGPEYRETGPFQERLNAVRSYLTGRNLEQAGQFLDAVAAYRQVLTQVGDGLPLKEAGERLQALQKEHPEAFPNSPKPN